MSGRSMRTRSSTRSQRRFFDLFTKAEMIVAWNAPTMNFVMYTVVLLIVLMGGEDIVLGTMMTGELTSIMV